MFLFVSPERFVMEDFRKIIHTIDASRFGLAFSYCVIDEVHCVSEWGHDFRTTYLMLGKNAQRFSKTKSGGPVSLIGLTATASFDVLTDIERELNIDTDDVSDAIISIDNTIRPELFFNVIENEIKYPTPILSQTLKDCIGVAKQSRIRENIENAIETLTTIDEKVVIKGLEQHFEEFEIAENSNTEEKRLKFKERIINIEDFNTYSDVVSVIFCPHTKGTFGVTDQASLFPPQVPMAVFENLNIENKGYFIGGDDKIKRETRQAAQKYFIDFMEGKINYMVCTKAFGMGLDKSNIRMIHHVNFSSSPESYVQEAGRAGRDKVKSICSVYIDSNIYYTIVPDFILKNKHLFETTTIRKMARDIFEYYNDFQNRISEKYFGTKEDLINNFNQIGIQLEDSYIREFNQDLSIHEFFHKNSFKGIETEIYQLDRLFNYKEGINKYRYKLIQDKYNNEFDDEVNFNLTINGDYSGSMFLNNSEGKAIGKLFTKATPPIATIWGLGANGVPNLEKTEQILNFISAEWGNGDREDQTLFEFLSNNVELELNGGLSLIEYFVQSNEQKFKFIVPVSFQKNELEKRIKSDFHLETLPMLERHDYSTTDFLETLKRFSVNFEDLILRIEEQWGRNFFDNPDFMEKRGEYKRLYYSDVNMADISKMIYRLHSIGFIDDYTIDYNLGLFTLSIVKKNKNYYIEKTYTHLLKYLSRSKSIEKRDEIKKKSNEMDVFKTIQLCVRTILEFTYDDIVKKRKDAVSDLFSFISDSIDLSEQKGNDTSYEGFWYNYYFKEEMYYYFNAKYARANYTIEGQPYSLLDDTEKGRKSSWETFEKFAKVLNEQASFISECKMMRGSCKRIWRTLSQIDEEDEFVLKILYAFATFGLSNKYYYEDAKNYLIKGFRVLYNQTDYKQLNSCINNFEKLLIDSTNNKDFILYLNLAKQCIMIEINRLYTKEIISQIKEK
jgi:ATP-dependent DNA helicase RecQ